MLAIVEMTLDRVPTFLNFTGSVVEQMKAAMKVENLAQVEGDLSSWETSKKTRQKEPRRSTKRRIRNRDDRDLER